MNQEQQNQPAQQPAQPPQMTQGPAPDTNTFAEQPKVQYVVMQKSLEGLSGWLVFFLSVFALDALSCIANTFKEPVGLHTVTDPIIATFLVASVVLIAMRKKIALWAIYATLGLSLVISIVNTIINSGGETGMLVGTILASTVLHGLLALYFFSSKRVKATLIH